MLSILIAFTLRSLPDMYALQFDCLHTEISARHVCSQLAALLTPAVIGFSLLQAPRAGKLPTTPGLTTNPSAKATTTPNAYALFVKEHMSTIKMAHPKGVHASS